MRIISRISIEGKFGTKLFKIIYAAANFPPLNIVKKQYANLRK